MLTRRDLRRRMRKKLHAQKDEGEKKSILIKDNIWCLIYN